MIHSWTIWFLQSYWKWFSLYSFLCIGIVYLIHKLYDQVSGMIPGHSGHEYNISLARGFPRRFSPSFTTTSAIDTTSTTSQRTSFYGITAHHEDLASQITMML